MRATWLAAVAALILAVVAVRAAPTVAPQAVRQSIRDQGARQTINELQRRGQWEAITDAMDAGQPAWIALAPLLAGGSDAGSAEDLGISLAFALPKNPQAVLTALDMRDGVILGPSRVCGRPFIEGTEPRGYKARSLAALGRVTAPDLGRRKQACLHALSATR